MRVVNLFKKLVYIKDENNEWFDIKNSKYIYKRRKKMSFKSWRSYWVFRDNVKNNSRFILDKESKDFLMAIEDTCLSRIKIISISTPLWRAQVGCDYIAKYEDGVHIDDVPVPFDYERMKPIIHSAAEGRANPKGIPYLYVATDKETAMSEWSGNLNSYKEFKQF